MISIHILSYPKISAGANFQMEVDSTALYTAQAGSNAKGFSTIDLSPGNAATPTFLVCTTSYLVLNGRRNVDLRY